MSTKGIKKSSHGKKKIKKEKSSKNDNTPRKIKSKSKAKAKAMKISKPKSNVLNKPRKKKKKESTPKKKKHKSEDKSNEKIKKQKKKKLAKAGKSRKSTLDPIYSNSIPQRMDTSKRKKRKNSNIDNIKKQLLMGEFEPHKNKSNKNNKKNMLPNSAKKVMKKPAKKNKKEIAHVQSMKKAKDFQYNNNYNYNNNNIGASKSNYSMNPRRAISDMYGFGKHKKKKTNELMASKLGKKKKKKSDLKQIENKHKKKKSDKINLHRLKKKHVEPSSTEKLSLFRRKAKTKSKQRELLVIGDCVGISGNKYGIIRYKGGLNNVTGIWYGIELIGQDVNGDCDGRFNDESYFECEANRGIFIMQQSIEKKLKENEIENVLKLKKKKEKKQKKKRANTMTFSQTLAHQMGFKRDKNKEKKKQKKNKKSKQLSITGGNSKQKKGKKNKGKRSGTITTIIQKKDVINNNNNENKKKFKWEIPSKMHGVNGRKTSNGDNDLSDTATLKLSDTTSMGSYVCVNNNINNNNNNTTSTSGGHLFTKSDNNLQNIMSRGRRLSKSESEENNKRRTRSLSMSRDDQSWMTHETEEGNSLDRIKQNIKQQKELDLKELKASKSVNKAKEIGKLFEKHIQSATNSDGHHKIIETDKNKLKSRLKNEEDALNNAVDIVKDLGFLKYIKHNEIYSKIYIKKYRKRNVKRNDDDDEKYDNEIDFDLFDMNNMDILHKFEEKTREILCKVICKSIISISTIEILEMCNCDIDSDFMEILCEYLCVYYSNENENANISILSLQSNPISDRGMIALSKLINLNHPNLTSIKLQNNRKDISTLICQQICQALQNNQYIIKFEFQFRHYQWKDMCDKVIKRNAEHARLTRLQIKNGLSL